MEASILLMKMIASVIIVLLLSIIAERASMKIAGVLAGLPTATALVLFFYGIEVGPEFASSSAVYNIIGLVATMMFLFGYYHTSRIIGKDGLIWALLSAVSGIIFYLLTAAIISLFSFGLISSIIISAIFIYIFIYLYRDIVDRKVTKRLHLGCSVILSRSLFTVGFIILMTSIASFMGLKWAGIFSSAPASLCPLAIILHSCYGREVTHSFIKNIPYGLGSVITYSVIVSLTYPILGVYMGTGAAISGAFIFILLFRLIKSRMDKI